LTLGQAYKALSAFFGILALALGFLFLRMKWLAGVDFDLIGFFWLIRNLPRLTVLLAFLACAGAALSYWMRSWRASG
jgi:hypothetical protein